MSYTAALDHLYAKGLELAPASPTAPRRKFELEHMRTLARALGDPERRFPSILIAGTNGKGSTAATLSSILTAAGYRTGLYTSPHLSRVNERIQIDGQPISDDDFARLYFQIDSAAEKLVASGELPYSPSYFETITALAFAYYAEQKIDIAVLEVGLGGRLDATNIVDPLISILTDISLDHQDYLGNTIAEITREKAGILRHHGTLITLPQHPEANQAIGEAASTLELHAISAANYTPPAERLAARTVDRGSVSAFTTTTGVPPSDPEQAKRAEGESRPPRISPAAPQLPRNRYTITVANQPLLVDSPLIGQHQQRNIALAIAAAEELRNPTGYNLLKSNPKSYKISTGAIEKGIRNTRWPGRLELLTFPANESTLSTEATQPSAGPVISTEAAPPPNQSALSTEATQPPNRSVISTEGLQPPPEPVISTEAKRSGETRFSPDAATEGWERHSSAPLLLDVAHNPAGAWTLRAVIAHLPDSQPRTLLFSCLRDKDLREMAQILLPLFDASADRPHDHILFAPIDSPRAASLEDLAAVARELEIPAATAPTLAEALAEARRITPADGLIVATGSVYLIGELRTLALNGGAASA